MIGLDSLNTLLHNNQVVSGGLVLSAMGAVVVYARQIPNFIINKIRSIFISTIYVDHYGLVDSVNDWFSENIKIKNRANSYIFSGNVHIVPGFGTYFGGFYKNIPFWIHHMQIDNGNLGKKEVYTLSFLTKDRRKTQQFLQECYDKSYKKQITFYKVKGESWQTSKNSCIRSLDSVILDKDLKETLVKDIQSFLDSESWYKSIGIPYRRGYMLYGPPGNGKSSLVSALGKYFNKDIYILRLNGLTDSSLGNLMQNVEKDKIVLIEDVDCIVSGRSGITMTDSEEKNHIGVSFSGLLNNIDGVDTPEGRLLFITTNKINDIDAALLRPGRIDNLIEIKNSSKHQAAKMYKRFFKGSTRSNEFSDKMEDYVYSMADIQEHLLRHRLSEDDAINNIIIQHTNKHDLIEEPDYIYKEGDR